MVATAPAAVSESSLAAAEHGLKLASVVTAGFGALFALASHDATDAPVRWLSDILFWRLGDGVDQLTNTNHLADAIAGGVMFGWAVMMWLLADRLLAKAPSETKSIVLISLAGWFVLDSGGSIASGAWLNVISNVAFLAMFLLPLRKI